MYGLLGDYIKYIYFNIDINISVSPLIVLVTEYKQKQHN